MKLGRLCGLMPASAVESNEEESLLVVGLLVGLDHDQGVCVCVCVCVGVCVFLVPMDLDVRMKATLIGAVFLIVRLSVCLSTLLCVCLSM